MGDYYATSSSRNLRLNVEDTGRRFTLATARHPLMNIDFNHFMVALHGSHKTEGSCCDACRSAANLKEEISQTEETLRRLLAKRFTVLTEQNRRHDDIVRLPLEISGYIFEMSLPERAKWGAFRKQDKMGRMPSLLASVCTGWRDIALSTPRLWSTINITLSAFDPSTSSQIVQHWIDRSRTLPLSLNIALSRSTTRFNGGRWDPIFDVVNACSDRWRSLSLRLPGILLGQVRGNGRNKSSLRRLRVNTRCNWLGTQGPHPKLAFSKPLPRPKFIELVSVRPIGLSWSRLSNASLQNVRADECLELLKKAPQLTCCCVTNVRVTRFPDPSIHVVHRALKTLRLYTRQVASRVPVLESLMDALTLPNLQVFECDAIAALSPGHLLALIRRSSCPLVRLRTGSRSMVTSAENSDFVHRLGEFSRAN